jgi:F1F0 ATPase subunit 2
MNEILNLILALIAGFFLGAVFFGGLWWAVQKGLSSRKSAFWFLSSLLIRTSTAIAGFYFASDGHWKRLLICLFGFFVMRHIIVRFTRLPEENPDQLIKEVNNAT